MSTHWKIEGEYMEACSCDFLCPCITKNSTTPATHDFCKVAMTYVIKQGGFGDVTLDGVAFAVVAESKAVMSQGDWVLGIIVDERATDAQAAAVTAIASGQAGGPLAGFAPLIGEFRGMTRARIDYDAHAHLRTVTLDGQLAQTVEGVPSVSVPGECIAIDNTLHPANRRLNLATAIRNFIRCFGIEWDAPAGRTNGHFAPFAWQGQTA